MSGQDVLPSTAGRIKKDRSTLAAIIGWLNVMTIGELAGALLLDGSTASTNGATRAEPFHGGGLADRNRTVEAATAAAAGLGLGFRLTWTSPDWTVVPA
jgi:hypothetical protein